MSLLDLGRVILGTDVLLNILSHPEYTRFVLNFKVYLSSSEVSSMVLINYLHYKLDPIFAPFLDDENMNKIFEDKDLTDDQRVKKYVGKMVVFLHKNYEDRIMVSKEILVKLAMKNIKCIEPIALRNSHALYHRIICILSITIEDWLKSFTGMFNSHEKVSNFITEFNCACDYKSKYISIKRKRDTNTNDNDSSKRSKE